MGGLSDTEKKDEISKKLQQAYDEKKNVAQTRLQLINYFEQKLTTDEKEYLKDHDIEKYYLQKREEYLNDFSDFLMKKKEEENTEKLKNKEEEMMEKLKKIC